MKESPLALEGIITPTGLWNAIVIGLVLIGVIYGIAKFVILIRDEYIKRRDEKRLNKKDLTEQIADKVIERVNVKLDEKFQEIDEKFANDKIAIDRHERQLAVHTKQLRKAKTGLNALGQCVYVLFMRSNGGTVPENIIQSANESMTGYLFNKEGEEEDND